MKLETSGLTGNEILQATNAVVSTRFIQFSCYTFKTTSFICSSIDPMLDSVYDGRSC